MKMDSNYTQPNNPDYTDKPEDWLGSALVFANALGKLLEPNTGIVVELIGDMSDFIKGDKVIVSNIDEQIAVMSCDGYCEEHYMDGDLIKFE